ncbi:MAG: metallophosphoesterase family protein [Planctomycetota bacterium]
MHLAIISDVHANWEALRAVLDDIASRQIPIVVCGGDIVGYGSRPAEVIDLIQSRTAICIRGNHDHAVVTGDFASFSPVALRAGQWTRQQLRPRRDADSHQLRRWEFLGSRPLAARIDDVELSHGSPREPLFEYIFPPSKRLARVIARGLLDLTDARVVALGHTHVPMMLDENGHAFDVKAFADGGDLPEGRLVINPGSVGQPRDGDPRAAYVEVHGDLIAFRRVAYAVVKQAAEVAEIAGLGRDLAERLLVGR